MAAPSPLGDVCADLTHRAGFSVLHRTPPGLRGWVPFKRETASTSNPSSPSCLCNWGWGGKVYKLSKYFLLHKVMRAAAVPALYLNKMISHKAWPLLSSKHVSCCWQCERCSLTPLPGVSAAAPQLPKRAEGVQSPLLYPPLFLHPPLLSRQKNEVRCWVLSCWSPSALAFQGTAMQQICI